MVLRKIREGRISLNVPVADIPEHARRLGFFNPEMETDRDISVSALSIFRKMVQEKQGDPEKEIEICDLLCSTGARGIRYKAEVGGIVTMGDVNENAIELARKNVDENGLEAEILNIDANMLMSQRRFDVIDIDPFGSPYPFIDSAARSIGDFGLLCATATDTAALFGVYPKVSERRYGISSAKCSFHRELGTRILASFIMRELGKYNICFTPVLCYSKRHYVRVVGICERGALKVEEQMKLFEFMSVSEDSWKIGMGENCLGKIYCGPLHDKEFCSNVLDEIGKRKLHGEKILATMVGESDNLFYHDADNLASRLGIRMKISEIISRLQESGFTASRTVFSDTGIKTSAGFGDIENVFGKAR